LGKNSRTNVAIVAEIANKVTDNPLINETVVLDTTDSSFPRTWVKEAVVVDVTNRITPLINLRAKEGVTVDT
jgi:hypothetical protein